MTIIDLAIHVLMTEGGTAPGSAFHRVCGFRDEIIQEIFTHEVFSLLLRKKLIGLPLVANILRWRHTGFNVHSQVRAESKSEAERVGKYMRRPLLSLKRLFFDETAGRVRYQSSRQGSQEESMDYLEFIARVTSHIPDKGQVSLEGELTSPFRSLPPLLGLSPATKGAYPLGSPDGFIQAKPL